MAFPPLPDPDRVIALMREAAAVEILPRFRKLARHEISEKSPGDMVTAADIAAERHLAAGLLELMPGSRVVGEEGAQAEPEILGVLGDPDPVWIVDPVDGTQNFADGVPCFAVIIALAVGGDTVAGWIHDPIAGRSVWAAPGQGAWEIAADGTRGRLRAAAPAPIGAMFGSLGSGLRRKLEAARSRAASSHAEIPARMARLGCVGREYMDLADGRLHFARYGGRLKPWDHAAGVLVHREAGGFSGLAPDGHPYRPGRGIAPGPLLLAPDRAAWDALHRLLDHL